MIPAPGAAPPPLTLTTALSLDVERYDPRAAGRVDLREHELGSLEVTMAIAMVTATCGVERGCRVARAVPSVRMNLASAGVDLELHVAAIGWPTG